MQAQNLCDAEKSALANIQNLIDRSQTALTPELENAFLSVFYLGFYVSKYDSAAFFSDSINQSIKQRQQNIKNGQNNKLKQFPIAVLINYFFLARIRIEMESDVYQQQDLCEAIHLRLLSFLRECKSKKIQSLFSAYKKKTPDSIDSFAYFYYAPTPKRIAQMVNPIKPEMNGPNITSKTPKSLEFKQLSLADLNNFFNRKIKNKEIKDFLLLSINELHTKSSR